MEGTLGLNKDKNGGDALIVFTPSGKRGRFAIGTPVLTAARALGVDIDSVCGGRAICGRCQVTVSEGAFAKHGIDSRAGSLSPCGANEARYAAKRTLAAGRRLSCSALIQGDVVVDVPPESQVHKQVVRKRAEVREIALDPLVRLCFIEVEEPDMHEPTSDLERVFAALSTQWQITVDRADLEVVRALQAILRKGEWTITVAVHQAREGGPAEVIAAWPGFRDIAYGIAVDIGSTTIAAHLCNLHSGIVASSSGLMNPQIRFGEDLMSRVSYVMMNPGGDREMTAVVREAIGTLAGQVAVEAGIGTDDILAAVFVGNPIMHHLLLGIDPTELGGAPFALATGLALEMPARDLDLAFNDGARAYILPCIAGHVGADAAGVVLSEGPHFSDELTLIVDVGTNAEIVLGNRHKLLAASSPTGPAFEGAQISSGQRAAPGAIERVRIDAETLEPRFKVIGSDLWSDEPGFDDEVVQSGITGICGSGIIEVIAEMFLAGVISRDGVVDGKLIARSPRIIAEGRTFSYLLHDGAPRIMVTQQDVRAIQLAKAALYAGAKLLMDRLGVTDVERITLAGAFGSHIDVKYAMVLGLIPDCDLAKVTSAGNAAGTGARIALLNRAARREIEETVRRIEKVETAVEPAFQAHFVEAMAFPHKRDPFVNLARTVVLPVPKAGQDGDAGADDGGRRRRRRRG